MLHLSLLLPLNLHLAHPSLQLDRTLWPREATGVAAATPALGLSVSIWAVRYQYVTSASPARYWKGIVNVASCTPLHWAVDETVSDEKTRMVDPTSLNPDG